MEGVGHSMNEMKDSLLAQEVPEARDGVLGVLHELVFRLVADVLDVPR